PFLFRRLVYKQSCHECSFSNEAYGFLWQQAYLASDKRRGSMDCCPMQGVLQSCGGGSIE
ncbi:hypothetical protein, partial [Bacteroides heparinolyticus]|uniref:hypothetical protein n=1 Tax=Prevotella heparinolytica TaxID=28113 RepID=UPI0035A0AAC1